MDKYKSFPTDIYPSLISEDEILPQVSVTEE